MYKFANALITAGDAASAADAVNWLFNVDMDPSTGRFPQNAFVSGQPHWNNTQMDEQAMPIILAYRLGPSVYNPLWPKIRLTANYIYSTGPRTERGTLGGKPRLFALDHRRRNRRTGRRRRDRPRQRRRRRCGELAERRRLLAAERHRVDLYPGRLPQHRQQLQRHEPIHPDQPRGRAGRQPARRLESERLSQSEPVRPDRQQRRDPSCDRHRRRRVPRTGAHGGQTAERSDHPRHPRPVRRRHRADDRRRRQSRLVPLQFRRLWREQRRRSLRRDNRPRPVVADLRRRTRQLRDRREGRRKRRGSLSRRIEGVLDAARLHPRADLESEHDPARRRGRSFRLDR